MTSEELSKYLEERTIYNAFVAPRLQGFHSLNNYLLPYGPGSVFIYEGSKADSLGESDYKPYLKNVESGLREDFEPFLVEYSTNNVIKITKKKADIVRIDMKDKKRLSDIVTLDLFMYLHLWRTPEEIAREVRKSAKLYPRSTVRMSRETSSKFKIKGI